MRLPRRSACRRICTREKHSRSRTSTWTSFARWPLRASRSPIAIFCWWRPATRCSTIAKRSRFTPERISSCVAVAITRSRTSTRNWPRSCASPECPLAERAFDVAIVGGGLVGAALGYGLRDLGKRLAILDEGDVAFRAARGNFGLIWVQGKGFGMPAYGAWTQRSAGEWPAFAADIASATGIDVALRQG